jgi:hypothetical protein
MSIFALKSPMDSPRQIAHLGITQGQLLPACFNARGPKKVETFIFVYS